MIAPKDLSAKADEFLKRDIEVIAITATST